MAKIKVLVADDHRILAEGIRSLLEPTFELVAIVENGRALIAAAKELKPDVIVVDIAMPLLNDRLKSQPKADSPGAGFCV